MTSSTVPVSRGLTQVFDKYMLPKVAFGMVTLASISGAILTGWRHGWTEWPLLTLRWGAYWTVGLLLGAEIWRLLYLRPSVRARPEPDAVDYSQAMLSRYYQWQKGLLPLAGLLLIPLWMLHAGEPAAMPWTWIAVGAFGLAVAGSVHQWRLPPSALEESNWSWLVLVGLAVLTAAMSGLDVVLQSKSLSGLLIPNRIVHIWAFSAWLGGAFWNIFIAVPAGLSRVNMDTVILAHFQLERFRVVVRSVFALIVATGLVQTWAIFGWGWQRLFTTAFGYLILAKVGLILSLVAVFILCPMWRACSPIRGVCHLDEAD